MATVEYAALSFFVAGVLAVGGAVADAERLPGAVGAQIQRAYCLVAGGDCLGPGGPRPCVVAATSHERDRRLTISVMRLRDGRSAVVEELSDGRLRVTILHDSGAAAALSLGIQMPIDDGVRATAEVGAGFDAGYGRTFEVPDRAAADRLVKRLEAEDQLPGEALLQVLRFARERGPRGGAETDRFMQIGGGADAEAVLRALGAGGRVAGMRDLVGTVRVNRRTGEHTLGLRLDEEALAALASPLDSLGRVGGAAEGSLGAELTLGRDRRPTTLTLRRTVAVRGDARVGPYETSGGNLFEVEARLDLADPRARELTDRLLRAEAAALGPLAQHLTTNARIDTRLYKTTHDERTKGAGAWVVSGKVVNVTDTARLVAAVGREPGLGWSRRLDCLLAA
jgi:hypothetical protein